MIAALVEHATIHVPTELPRKSAYIGDAHEDSRASSSSSVSEPSLTLSRFHSSPSTTFSSTASSSAAVAAAAAAAVSSSSTDSDSLPPLTTSVNCLA